MGECKENKVPQSKITFWSWFELNFGSQFILQNGIQASSVGHRKSAREAKERIDPRLVEVPWEGRAHQVCRRTGVQWHPQGLRSAAQYRCGQHSGVSKRSRWPLQVNRGHTAPRTSRLPRYGSRARLPGGRHGSHSQPLRTTGVIVAMLPRMWNAPTFTRKCTVDILCIFNRSFLRFLLYLLFFDVFLFIYDIMWILLVLTYTVGLPLGLNPIPLCPISISKRGFTRGGRCLPQFQLQLSLLPFLDFEILSHFSICIGGKGRWNLIWTPFIHKHSYFKECASCNCLYN